jgi:hypothetical protein
MASLSSMSFGGGMAGGPLRCSMCGRREAAVDRLVRARSVHICDRCLAAAGEALAAAPAGQKVVRVRPPRARVADLEAAQEAIEDAFETVFSASAQAPIEERCRAIENGDNLGDAFEQAGQRRHGVDVTVDSVRFLDDQEAEVQFTLWLAGFGRSGMPRSGHAVRTADGWKVARETWCGLVSMIGIECPPAEPG